MGQAWGRIPQALIPAGSRIDSALTLLGRRWCSASWSPTVPTATESRPSSLPSKWGDLSSVRHQVKSSPPTRWSPRHFPAFSARLEILFL